MYSLLISSMCALLNCNICCHVGTPFGCILTIGNTGSTKKSNVYSKIEPLFIGQVELIKKLQVADLSLSSNGIGSCMVPKENNAVAVVFIDTVLRTRTKYIEIYAVIF